MIELQLQSVWSEEYTGALPFALPDGWRLTTHQWEVYQSMTSADAEVIIDTAMTGDGKTLAACLPLLYPLRESPPRGLLAYPTNELIRDQKGQLDRYLSLFGRRLEVQELNSHHMNRYATEHDAHRYETIMALMQDRHVLLTNPDVFHLIESFRYVDPRHNAASLAQKLANTYRYQVFDEFHVFGAPQIAAVLDALLFMRANGGPRYLPRTLFLSATPSPLLIEALDRCHIRCQRIEGRYRHGPGPFPGHRQILQPAILEVVAGDSSAEGVFGYCMAYLEKIRAFFSEHPGSKGAVICNSVLMAKRLRRALADALSPDITVGENTGLSSAAQKIDSFECQLMVATSTVDVGVDFRINLLIFESLNAGTFVQRLGRLGRHPGFSAYLGIAILPPFIVERLDEKYGAEALVERPAFFASLRDEVFLPQHDFEEYLQRWGSVLSALRLLHLCHVQVKERYATLVDRYLPAAKQLFAKAEQSKQRAKFLLRPDGKALREALTGFRGSSRLDVWVCDEASGALHNVALPWLLQNTNFALIDQAEALRLAVAQNEKLRPPYLGLYARIDDYLQERRTIQWRSRFALIDEEKIEYRAAERGGFRMQAAHPQVGEINRKLEDKVFCTSVAPEGMDLITLRRTFRLPPLFDLHLVLDQTSGASHVVAFDQDALLLDSIPQWRKKHVPAVRDLVI